MGWVDTCLLSCLGSSDPGEPFQSKRAIFNHLLFKKVIFVVRNFYFTAALLNTSGDRNSSTCFITHTLISIPQKLFLPMFLFSLRGLHFLEAIFALPFSTHSAAMSQLYNVFLTCPLLFFPTFSHAEIQGLQGLETWATINMS